MIDIPSKLPTNPNLIESGNVENVVCLDWGGDNMGVGTYLKRSSNDTLKM